MRRIDFNSGWTVRSLARPEEICEVTLPHDAMISEPRSAASVAEGNIGWFVGGDYVYDKTFQVPESSRGKKLILEFESVYHNAELLLNGEKIGQRPYGYTNFYVDLSKRLKFGEENTLTVIAHNADQPNSRWYPGTGIFRPVWLFEGDEKYIPVNGVRIRTLSIPEKGEGKGSAKIEITVRTSIPGEYSVEILNAAGSGKKSVSYSGLTGAGKAKKKDLRSEALGSVLSSEDYDASGEYGAEERFELEIPSPQLWSVEAPNLYTCRVTFGEDQVQETFGIRTLSWGPEMGLTLNGERVILRGACIHHDNGLLGACAFPEAEERRVRILKENGYNAIRSAHNPCSKALLDACDKLGVLMMDEYVDCWYIHKTRYDYVNHLKNWWQADLREMVDKDYNHPSVIMYSTGNEVSETAQEKGIAFTKEMTDYLHQLDNSRPVTCGVNIFFNFLSSIGLGVYSDDKAEKSGSEGEKKAQELKDGKPVKKKSVGSEFYNTLANVLGSWFMKTGATLPMCDWRTRDAYGNMDIAGYNYGIFRYRHDLKKYPERLILGSETFCFDAFDFWEIARDNPRVIGDFVWVGIDYIGECALGGAEYKEYRDFPGALAMTGGGGCINLCGKRRAEGAYTLVALEQEKGPLIAVSPVFEDEKLTLSGWQMTKAIESWSFRGCRGKMAEVEVYARGDSVELFLNGKPVGTKKLKKAKAIFKVPYADGTLTAVSKDRANQVIGRYSLKTAGRETVLSVKPESRKAEPGRLIYVPISYTDKEGIWKPMEKHKVRVLVENGTLAALGSANPYVGGNYNQPEVSTYFGEAMAIVRAGRPDKGPVKITVRDEEGEKTVKIPF